MNTPIKFIFEWADWLRTEHPVAGCAQDCRGGGFDDFKIASAIVFAESEVVAARGTAITIAHQEASVLEAKQMAGETPDADGVGDGPGLSAVGGFGLQSFLSVERVVVADVNDEVAVAGFYAVEFVVVSGGVAGPRGDGGEPAPGLAIVCGYGDANFAAGIGVLLAGVEEAAIADLDCAVRAGDWDAVGLRPGEAAVSRTDHPGTEE